MNTTDQDTQVTNCWQQYCCCSWKEIVGIFVESFRVFLLSFVMRQRGHLLTIQAYGLIGVIVEIQSLNKSALCSCIFYIKLLWLKGRPWWNVFVDIIIRDDYQYSKLNMLHPEYSSRSWNMHTWSSHHGDLELVSVILSIRLINYLSDKLSNCFLIEPTEPHSIHDLVCQHSRNMLVSVLHTLTP